MFNFTKAKENAQKDLNNRTLGAIILGAPGAGKSSLAGTAGERTLYLYSGGESHGVSAASTSGTDVVGVRVDRDDSGAPLGADGSYQRIIDILAAKDGIVEEGFKLVVLDSLTEIESIIRGTTKWKRECESASGKHNSFAEPTATINMFRPILSALRDLALDHGIHYVATCPLMVQALGEDGQISEASPKLSGYSVAESLIMQFPDVLVVGRIVRNDKQVFALQFNAGVSKVSKDATGNVKKIASFNPRITGVRDLPEVLPANLAQLIAGKEKGTFNVKTKA